MQVFRFQHWLVEKTDYKAAFRGKSSGAFECKPSTVTAAPAGPDGQELLVEVSFEPSSIGDDYHETLVVNSTTGGEYECQVNGRCLPPKPSGPFEVVKVMSTSIVPIAYRNFCRIYHVLLCPLHSFTEDCTTTASGLMLTQTGTQKQAPDYSVHGVNLQQPQLVTWHFAPEISRNAECPG